MNKDIVVVTGGEGFIGSQLIKFLLKKTSYRIISIDNDYSKSRKIIKNNRIKYIRGSTRYIDKLIKAERNKINTIFHFGEFSRIVASFSYADDCLEFNTVCTQKVMIFCIRHNIKFIYSASSSIFGNLGKDQNLSPYSWSKAKNIELIKNFRDWFNLKYEICYFYNVYGDDQIEKGKMAAVIGIFLSNYRNKKSLQVVKPGTQRRDFTHVEDIVRGVFLAWKKNLNKEYLLRFKKSYSIIEIAKMFGCDYELIPERPGERFSSTKKQNHNAERYLNFRAKIDLKNYIRKKINE